MSFYYFIFIFEFFIFLVAFALCEFESLFEKFLLFLYVRNAPPSRFFSVFFK